MPKSFLISRRRKLSSCATELPHKSPRILKPCLHSEDDTIQLQFSVSSDTDFENHRKKKNYEAGKYLLFSGKLAENEHATCWPNRVQYFPVPLDTSHHDNKGNAYFQSLAAITSSENWQNSRIKYGNGEDPSFTAKEDSTKGDNAITDNNNNINKRGNNHIGISSEFHVEGRNKRMLLIDQPLNSDLRSMNHDNASLDQAVKICPDELSSSPTRPFTSLTHAAADQFPRDPTATEVSPMKYLFNSIRETHPFTEKRQTISSRSSQNGLSLNFNDTPQTSISVSTYNCSGTEVQRDVAISKQIMDRKLSRAHFEETQRIAVLENTSKMALLASDVSSMVSSEELSVTWQNGTVGCQGWAGNQRSCLGDICGGGVWQFGEKEESAARTGGDDREMDIANMKEGHGDHQHRLLATPSNNSPMCSPLPQPSCSPHKSPSSNMTSVLQSPNKISSCENITSSEAADNSQERRQERRANDNNISHISLWRTFDRSLSPVVFQKQNNHSPVNAHLNKSASPDSKAMENPGEKRNSLTPDLTSCHITSILLHSGSRTLVTTNPEVKDALTNSQIFKIHNYSAKELSDQINNKGIIKKESCEKSSLQNEPQPHIRHFPEIKTEKHRKRPFKSFMISNILSDHNDSEEDENQPLPAMDCYTNSNSDPLSTPSSLAEIQAETTSSVRANLLDERHCHECSNNCKSTSQRLQVDCGDLHKQIFKIHRPHHRHLNESCNNIIQHDKQNNSNLPLINPLKLQNNNRTSLTSLKQACPISAPLSNGLRVQEMARVLNFPAKDSNLRGSFDTDITLKPTKTTDETLSTGSFNQTLKFDSSNEAQTQYLDQSSVDYIRLPPVPLQTDLLSARITRPEPTHAPTWRRTVNGVYNPVPIRYHPMPTFFNILTPALYCQSSLSPPSHAELSNHNMLAISKQVDQIKDSFFVFKDTLRQSPGCDASSNVSSMSSLTSPTIISPKSSHGSIPEKHSYTEVSRQLFHNNDSMCPSVDAGYGHSVKVQKPEINESKSFKSILEQRNVKLECINGGNGIKNPLLNTDFVGNKISLVPTNCALSCPVCKMTFDLAKHLQKHLKSHREIKRFLCSFCGKGFNDTFDLKRHTRTHTGVRPYKCNQCDKAFTQRCSLESHCRKIHGLAEQLAFNERRLKVYVCEDCGHSTDLADDHYAHNRLAHPTSHLKRRVST